MRLSLQIRSRSSLTHATEGPNPLASSPGLRQLFKECQSQVLASAGRPPGLSGGGLVGWSYRWWQRWHKSFGPTRPPSRKSVALNYIPIPEIGLRAISLLRRDSL